MGGDFNRQAVLNFNARQRQLVIGIFDFARGIRSARQCAVSFFLNGLYIELFASIYNLFSILDDKHRVLLLLLHGVEHVLLDCQSSVRG